MTALLSSPRLLGETPDLPRHLQDHGPLPERLTIDQVAEAGITGRGGAAFPVARKLATMRPGGTVIANGCEGEPRSRKDATLLHRAPHLAIDGLLLVARLTAATSTVLAVKESAAPAVRRALAERADAGSVVLHVARPGFLSGEATALSSGVAGRAGLPTDRIVHLTAPAPRRPPTLVQNVETLAHLARIARVGPRVFRDAGAPDDPGTRLVSVSGDVQESLVVEAPGGARLDAVLEHAAVDVRDVRAVLVGGYHGVWTSRFDQRLTAVGGPDALRAGAGVLVVLGRARCGLGVTAQIARYLAEQTAGQCGPCVNGLPALASAMEGVAAGRSGAIAEARRLVGVVDGSGACHHPDGTARMVASALTAFADDVVAHESRRCTAVRR